ADALAVDVAGRRITHERVDRVVLDLQLLATTRGGRHGLDEVGVDADARGRPGDDDGRPVLGAGPGAGRRAAGVLRVRVDRLAVGGDEDLAELAVGDLDSRPRAGGCSGGGRTRGRRGGGARRGRGGSGRRGGGGGRGGGRRRRRRGGAGRS